MYLSTATSNEYSSLAKFKAFFPCFNRSLSFEIYFTNSLTASIVTFAGKNNCYCYIDYNYNISSTPNDGNDKRE